MKGTIEDQEGGTISPSELADQIHRDHCRHNKKHQTQENGLQANIRKPNIDGLTHKWTNIY
jgi:hypothetical protein